MIRLTYAVSGPGPAGRVVKIKTCSCVKMSRPGPGGFGPDPNGRKRLGSAWLHFSVFRFEGALAFINVAISQII